MEVTDTGAYCNQGSTTVEVTHDDLLTGGTPGTGFTNTVAFTPTVTFTNGANSPIVGNQTGVAVGTFTGMKVKATLIAPTSLLVAGTYIGKITVTLSPTS